ncbi:unnamed protein product [Ilex paraguariensis]|uniref:BHLH domain-containing protein n=1 Tax=Ilex paraguariensis TaxID=185542 RepID=A0ABC8SCQ1_9AQUA
MYSSASEAVPRDMKSSYLLSSTFNHSLGEGEFVKNKEVRNLDIYHNDQQQQQQSSGLMRYRSAPSSFFAALMDNSSGGDGGGGGGGRGGEDYFNHQLERSPESESESMFATPPPPIQGNGSGNWDSNLHFSSSMMKQEVKDLSCPHPNNEYSSAVSQLIYETSPPPPPPPVNSASGVGSYSVVAMENPTQLRTSNANCSNLIRQSSSPAEFFSGFSVSRASNGTYREMNSSTGMLNNHFSFPSGPSSCSRFMPQIAENVSERIGTGSPENDNTTNGCYVPSFSNDSWNDSMFTSLKRNRDGDVKMFPSLTALESQNGSSRNYTPGLTHHLSLPKTSAEMAAIEKVLQFQQDSTPCKIRAKRGFATHPRSIAERNRRIRISERMRRLQELFPNMDKQTNTADMLDLAVEHIKDLQEQVQTLTDTRAKCTCSSEQK